VNSQLSFSAALLKPDLPLPATIKGSVPRRFAVYRNNVTVGLTKALQANFPAIHKLLGDVYFTGLAREFAQRHPPQSPLMFLYGDQFPAFLDAQDDLAIFPYLGDVARLEQQWRLSYHAADAPVLHPVVLASMSEDELLGLRLTAHPAFALLSSDYAFHQILIANRDAAAPAIANLNTPEQVLVTRPYYEVKTQTVTAGVGSFLRELAQGNTLAQAAEQALAIDGSFDLTTGISVMLTSGAFEGLAD
jgi:hypothetical protein